jgi:hypothetical protein
MSDKTKRGVSLLASAAAYLVLALEGFGVFDLGSVWNLVTGVVGFVFSFYGIEFVKPVRELPAKE